MSQNILLMKSCNNLKGQYFNINIAMQYDIFTASKKASALYLIVVDMK